MIWKSLNAKCDRTIYLSIFRIYLCFHLLKKILLMWPSTDFLFGKDGFIVSSRVFFDIVSIDSSYFTENSQIFFSFIIILAIFVAFGIGRWFSFLLLFIAWYILQKLNTYVLNGGDNYLIFILLYMCFANSYSYFSLNKSDTFEENSLGNFLTNLSVISILTHLCLIYFISGISKIHTDLWYNGVAMYYILNLERFAGTDYNYTIAKNGFLVTVATYGTMFWEMLFPCLISIEKMRIPVLLCGVILHLSIFIFMMIHDFEILYIMVYGFFFTDRELLDLKTNILARLKKITPSIQKFERVPFGKS